MHKSYFRGLMSGQLPADVSIDQLDSEDGLFLDILTHNRIIHSLSGDGVGMVVDADGSGEIQFRSGPTQEKSGGVRFAPVPSDSQTFCWISFED